MSWKDLLVMGLGSIFQVMTPELKQVLNVAALNVYRKARQTPNPFDDMGAGILCAILGVDTSFKE